VQNSGINKGPNPFPRNPYLPTNTLSGASMPGFHGPKMAL
jgi:hypothetical protein